MDGENPASGSFNGSDSYRETHVFHSKLLAYMAGDRTSVRKRETKVFCIQDRDLDFGVEPNRGDDELIQRDAFVWSNILDRKQSLDERQTIARQKGADDRHLPGFDTPVKILVCDGLTQHHARSQDLDLCHAARVIFEHI